MVVVTLRDIFDVRDPAVLSFALDWIHEGIVPLAKSGLSRGQGNASAELDPGSCCDCSARDEASHQLAGSTQ